MIEAMEKTVTKTPLPSSLVAMTEPPNRRTADPLDSDLAPRHLNLHIFLFIEPFD